MEIHRSIWFNVHWFVSSDELEDDDTAMPSYIEAIVITDELFLDLRKQYVYCGSSGRIELRIENGFVMQTRNRCKLRNSIHSSLE